MLLSTRTVGANRAGQCLGYALLTAGWLLATPAAAGIPPLTAADSLAVERAYIDSTNATFHYQTGRVQLPGGVGYLDVPPGMRFLDSAQTHDVLERLWGNTPDDQPLGMLFPTSLGPADGNSWGFMVEYLELGHVADDDADDIDYDDLLRDLKQETRLGNADRVAKGYEPITLLGWASPPYYDAEHHVLHWAKLLRFGPSGAEAHHTLNYDVRLLGRKGVLQLQAIAGEQQLDVVKAQIPRLIANTRFASGLEYTEFDPDIDDIAAYSLGGLVAGKVLAKAGVLALVLKFWKVLALGVTGAVAAVRRWLLGRQE